MQYVQMGGLRVSRFILGSNPFSGFSHQNPARDAEMMDYYSVERIKQTLREAEALGVNTLIARTDRHIVRMLMEYRNDGGKLQWFAQTCPELGSMEACIGGAAANGAAACYIHGGVMDHLFAQGRISEVPPALAAIREAGMAAGVAAHNPAVIEWANEHLDVDFMMCCYYNSARRDQRAEHVSGMAEWFNDEDRDAMTRVIATLSCPAIHYKILAAGRNDPQDAFAFAARHLRENDAVCVGVFTKDGADMLKQDVELLNAAVEKPAVPA